MTIDACGLQWFIFDDPFVLDDGLFMTLLTLHILVFSGQREFRLCVMIEQ